MVGIYRDFYPIMIKAIHCDFLIIGAGIIGLAIAKELNARYPTASIIILEKESDIAQHSSGRNSGVLHAGFYYHADSLKAKFTRDGNRELTQFCLDNDLKINQCQKVVVAKNEKELPTLQTLYERGQQNGVEVELVDEQTLAEQFANVKTHKQALVSPNTSTVDPQQICHFLAQQLRDNGVQIICGEGFKSAETDNRVTTTQDRYFQAGQIINCAGLYADKIARHYGFSKQYTIIPFKGLYLEYDSQEKAIPVTTNVYPVPDADNPFLGVHYTVTVDGKLKIGPTAVPAFWRENYKGLNNFRFKEFWTILRYEIKLFLTNAFNFRRLAFKEMSKYRKSYFSALAAQLLNTIDHKGFKKWSKPGIRAQLLNTQTLELVKDFVVEGDNKTVHVLNAVSPAFTSSFPLARWVVDHYIEKEEVAE